LVELPGVGRKVANLVVVEAFDQPGICVDTHVHRITNRWGYVKTKTPEETEMKLRDILPPRHWKEINPLLVAFGQNICRPTSPKCSVCPIAEFCDKVGVEKSR
jgi:endonuclease-3